MKDSAFEATWTIITIIDDDSSEPLGAYVHKLSKSEVITIPLLGPKTLRKCTFKGILGAMNKETSRRHSEIARIEHQLEEDSQSKIWVHY